jgi:hypothetical protein
MLIENVLLRQLRGSLSATTRNHRWKITTVGCEIVQGKPRHDSALSTNPVKLLGKFS